MALVRRTLSLLAFLAGAAFETFLAGAALATFLAGAALAAFLAGAALAAFLAGAALATLLTLDDLVFLVAGAFDLDDMIRKNRLDLYFKSQILPSKRET
ncbi:MAG: hypothetical protein EBU26_08345 [Verrucomicrobia bacterium]|nr:hypothetical protein [Verrucomicrobiota bacterium]